MRAPEHAFLSSRPAFEQFVAAWEAGTLPKPQWTHAAHVAVSACYTVRFDESAFDSMKAGILRYNEAVGTINGPDSGYHETLTRFWSTLIARHLQGITDPWQAACRAVEQFGEGRTLHTLYYSFDVVRSLEARRAWTPPDLRSL
jgi:hypothetical protein